MANQIISVDLDKGYAKPESVTVRRGEDFYSVFYVDLTLRGAPLKTSDVMSSATYRFKAKKGKVLIDLPLLAPVNTNGLVGRLTVRMTQNATAFDGVYDHAYIEIRSTTGGTNNVTTQDIPFEIIHNVDLTQGEVGTYENNLEQIIATYQTKLDNLYTESTALLTELYVTQSTRFNSYYAEVKQQFDDIIAMFNSEVHAVASVNGKTGLVTLTKSDIGLSLVPNYQMATLAEAIAGTQAMRFMSPYLVAKALEPTNALATSALKFSSTQIVGQDPNTIKTAGIYYCNNASSANMPQGASRYGYLYVYTSVPAVMHQYRDMNNDIYIRTYSPSADSWSTWEKLVKDNDELQKRAITKPDGTALISVSSSELIINKIANRGAGLMMGEATGTTADSPNGNNCRLLIFMVNSTAGSVLAIDSLGNAFSRAVSGSTWRGDWVDLTQGGGSVNVEPESNLNHGGLNWIAHRGNNTEYPENSICAFKNANRHWGIETDIQVTSDGKWVIMHDATVDRTTNGTGNVKDMTLAQFRALRIDAGPNIDVLTSEELTPPTIEEYLAICKAKAKVPVIEIKSATYSQQNYDDLVTILTNFGYNGTNCTIASFNTTVLTEIRKRYSNMELCLFVSYLAKSELDSILAIGGKMCASCSYTSSEMKVANVEMFHQAGVKVGCWTVPDSQFEAMKAMKVDYITTNSLSGNLRYAALTYQNGFTTNPDVDRIKESFVEEIDGGMIHLVFNVKDGINTQNSAIATLPDWAVPMYRQYSQCAIRKSTGAEFGTFDINGRRIPGSATKGTLSIGLNWADRTNWASGETVYKV